MVTIVIADDHKLFAQGLANILSEDKDLLVKAIFNDGKSMVDYLTGQDADIALVDLNMPHFDGKSTLLLLKEMEIESKRIVLSMYAEESLLKECMEIGIEAYLMKDTEPEVLINAIKEVHEGSYHFHQKPFIKPKKNKLFKDDFINKYKLSKREIEVVHLILEGLTNIKIAKKLFLAPYTVDTHRKNILHKLGINKTAELAKIAVEQNIVQQKNIAVEQEQDIVQQKNTTVEQEQGIVQQKNTTVEQEQGIVQQKNTTVEQEQDIVQQNQTLNY